MRRASFVVALVTATIAHAQQPSPRNQPTQQNPELQELQAQIPPPPVLPPQPETRLGPNDTLSFDDAVKKALTRNPTVQVAVEEIQRARAIVEEVRSAALPQFYANGTYTRVEADRRAGTGASAEIVVPANQINASLSLVVPIMATRSWVQWNHAKDNVDVAHANAADVRRQLAFTTARTYLSILTQHKVIEVAERAVATAKAHYDFAHQRFVGGYGTRVDEVRAAQEVSSDVSQLESAMTQLARLREALGVLLGLERPIDCTEDVELPTPLPVDQGLKEASEQRSDVVLAKQRLLAAQHVAHDDWADYVPTLNGSFQPFFQYPATLSLPEWGYQGVLSLTWQIYDGGLRYGLAKERTSLRLEAQTQLEGTVRQARSDVRAADEEIRHAAEALKAAQQAAQLALDAVKLTNLGYRGGASTNIEVIDAERQARDAGTAVAVAEDAWRQAVLDMLIASGKFPQGT